MAWSSDWTTDHMSTARSPRSNMKTASKHNRSEPKLARAGFLGKARVLSSKTTAMVFREVHTLLRHKKFESARKTLLSSRTGRVKAPYNTDLNHAWYIVGDLEFREGRYARAMRCFRTSLKHDSRDWMSLWALADCYCGLKQPKKALSYYKRALRFVPANGALTYNIGNMYFDLGQYQQAIAAYQRITAGGSDLKRMTQKNLQLAQRMSTQETRKK